MFNEAKHAYACRVERSRGIPLLNLLIVHRDFSTTIRFARNDSDETMSTNLISSGTTARQKVNLRTPDVMAAVQEQVESHYRSDIIEKIRRAGGIISVGDTTRAPGQTIWLLLRRRARD